MFPMPPDPPLVKLLIGLGEALQAHTSPLQHNAMTGSPWPVVQSDYVCTGIALHHACNPSSPGRLAMK